ncbi:glycosyltransferase family 1 protein [Microbacterium sp. BG28]|uniref:glycosyltransferase family 4 protein n=1 Tax=Microbacterium sp. BG28 TaxID=3097356 RepID=UPI002A5A3A20|nr:glycosyltransferase family 1 protein [Microbacterium sp. BG28]MDY0830155.1 glycosyltransferase family 1 protein [Microbacterium sp. BG28]
MSRRILFDGYWLADGPPSGKNVVLGMISGWASAFPGDVLDVAFPSHLPRFSPPIGSHLKPVRSHLSNQGLWAAIRIGREAAGYDAVITQNFTPLVGSGDARRATFLHDAMYKEHPEWFTRAEQAYLSLASFGLRQADAVLTSSDAERSRIARLFPNAEPRTHAIGLAVPVALATAGVADAPASSYEKPFILSVGRLNVRKNLSRLIEAFELSGLAQTHDLRIVGAPDGRFTAINTSGAVRFTGGISDAELASLYRACDFFVFPSLDEGFGLPLIEAAHFGAPSAASDIAAFRELGVAEALFDPKDTAGIAAALRVMADENGRSVRHTVVSPSAVSWESNARRARAAIFN